MTTARVDRMGFWPPHLDGVVTLRGREILSLSRDLSSNSWSCRLVTDQFSLYDRIQSERWASFLSGVSGAEWLWIRGVIALMERVALPINRYRGERNPYPSNSSRLRSFKSKGNQKSWSMAPIPTLEGLEVEADAQRCLSWWNERNADLSFLVMKWKRKK